MENWKENAINYFKRCYDNQFHQEYEFVKGPKFCQVIGCAVYGEQADAEIVENDDTKFGFSKEKADHIIKIQDKMFDVNPTTTKIRVFKTMIWMYIDENNQGPTIAFRFMDKKDRYVFIDASCRIYKNWRDYRKNNKLPACQVAYPRDGMFQVDSNGDILVDFKYSPACSLKNRFVSTTDTLVKFTGTTVSTVAGLVGLFLPVTVPLSVGAMIAGTTGFYGTMRSTQSLMDKNAHDESISVVDSEARAHWMNIITAPLEVFDGSTIINKMLEFLDDISVLGSFTMSSVTLANNLGNLFGKETMKPDLNAIDIASFVISTVFWSNSIMDIHTAETIIKSIQHEAIKNHDNSLDQKEAKQSMVENTIDDTVPRDSNNPHQSDILNDNNAEIMKQTMSPVYDSEDFIQVRDDPNIDGEIDQEQEDLDTMENEDNDDEDEMD